MTDFVELPNGRLLNTQAIRDFDPARSNRVNYLNGSFEQLAPEYGDVLKEALTTANPTASEPAVTPRRQTTKKKTAEKKKESESA